MVFSRQGGDPLFLRSSPDPREKVGGMSHRIYDLYSDPSGNPFGAGSALARRRLDAGWRHFYGGKMKKMKKGNPSSSRFRSWEPQVRDPSPILAEAPPGLELRSS